MNIKQAQQTEGSFQNGHCLNSSWILYVFPRPQHKDEEQLLLLQFKDNLKNCNQSNKVDLGIKNHARVGNEN